MFNKELLDTYISTIKDKKIILPEWEDFCKYIKSFSYFKELIKSGILD